MTEKQLKIEKLESGRMYHVVEDFVRRYRNIIIKDEARTLSVADPTQGNKRTTLTALIGHLVAEYERQTDVVNGLRDLRDSQKYEDFQLFMGAMSNRNETVIALHKAIQLARAYKFLDEGLDKELSDLREKNAILERDLKNCMDNYQKLRGDYDGLRSLVHGGYLLSTVREDSSQNDDAQ